MNQYFYENCDADELTVMLSDVDGDDCEFQFECDCETNSN